jgi:enoyl-CoA hydratase/carnithine racemase
MSDLSVAVADHVAVMEVQRGPDNYFDQSLLQHIADVGEELAASRQARVILLCSEGRHFCAGANFGAGALRDDRERSAAEVYKQASRLFELELPVVAAVQGSAVGGGLGLACAADFRVASRRSRFHANFSKLGFHHGFGLSVSLPRIVGPQRALELLTTSRRLSGDQAFGMGLVDRLAADGAERDEAHSLAMDIAALAPLAVRSIKETMKAGLANDVRVALGRELQEQRRLWKTEDSKIGIAANLDRATPHFIGK